MWGLPEFFSKARSFVIELSHIDSPMSYMASAHARYLLSMETCVFGHPFSWGV